MLTTQVNSVNTEWKDVITDFIDKNPDVWKETEEKYAKECEDFEGILGIYPKRENIFRCFKYFNPTDTRVIGGKIIMDPIKQLVFVLVFQVM